MEPIVAQKAVIKVGEKYLLLHRSESEKAFPGLWDFPGGKVEKDEELLASLIREVREETSLAINSTGVVYEYEASLQDRPVRFVLHEVVVIAGDPTHVVIGAEHSEFRLATKEEIMQLSTMPYMKSYLESLS